MKRTLLAALLLGTTTSFAGAEVVMVYDAALGEKFEIKREIVDQVQEVWGETAAYATGNELPEELTDDIVAAQPMPAAAPIEPAPAVLGDLPKLLDDSRWVKSGNHLIELTPDNMVVMVVYDVLP